VEPLTPLAWQDQLWRQLLTSRDRIPHALLLHGPRGIGKRHFARALAQALLCETPGEEGAACGHCAGCQLFAADNHPDLRWLVPSVDLPERDEGEEGEALAEPASAAKPSKASREILIDQVRDIGDFLALASHRGGRRVVLLIPAEALNAPAANALLKILEEPPGGTVFIAVSDAIDAVLPTVRSRCVLLRVPVPDQRAALAWLKARGIEDAEIRLAEAGGAPVGLDDEGTDDSRRLSPEFKTQLLDLLARGARLTLADIASAVPRDVGLSEAIRLFQRWGWDLLAERAAGRVRYYPQRQGAIASVARACDPQRLLVWLGQLTEAQAVAEHPLNARLAVESALIGYLSTVRPVQ
jgi:DNA polymerase-3 subunit delta'